MKGRVEGAVVEGEREPSRGLVVMKGIVGTGGRSGR
jgi:hypothetical protein